MDFYYLFSSTLIRIIAAFFCGLLIGAERELKNRGAGLKTHILVCIGSAVVMLVSEKLIEIHPQYVGDISRMGSQVISGVGFLGVGTILITGKRQIRGLTTAAGLWTTACIGLAIGIGYFELAIASTIFVIFTFKIIGYLDDYLDKKMILRHFYVEIKDTETLREIIKIAKNLNLKIRMIENKTELSNENTSILIISVEGRGCCRFFDEVSKLDNIIIEDIS